jgi:hypothetical protein
MYGLLLYLGITLFLKFGINQIAALGFGLARYCETVGLEFAVLDKRTVIRGVVFILIAVLFLICRFGLVDFKRAAQIQLIQIFMLHTGVGFFGIRREYGTRYQKDQAHQQSQKSQAIQVLHSILRF